MKRKSRKCGRHLIPNLSYDDADRILQHVLRYGNMKSIPLAKAKEKYINGLKTFKK